MLKYLLSLLLSFSAFATQPTSFLEGERTSQPVQYHESIYEEKVPDDGKVHIASYLPNEDLINYSVTNKHHLTLFQREMKERLENFIFPSFQVIGSRILALNSAGKVYSWGNNQNGEAGLGFNSAKVQTPEEVTALSHTPIVQLVAGGGNLALSRTGKVYAWGKNDVGQLGLGDRNNRNTPEEITFLSDKNICSLFKEPGQYNFAISREGKVYAWGSNANGQLPLEDKQERLIPEEVVTLNDKNIKYITAHTGGGLGYGFALSDDGKVYHWGYRVERDTRRVLDRFSAPEELPSLRDKNIRTFVNTPLHKLALSYDREVYLSNGNSHHRTYEEVAIFRDQNIKVLQTRNDGSAVTTPNSVYIHTYDGKIYYLLGRRYDFRQLEIRNPYRAKSESIKSLMYGGTDGEARNHYYALTQNGKIFTWTERLIREWRNPDENEHYDAESKIGIENLKLMQPLMFNNKPAIGIMSAQQFCFALTQDKEVYVWSHRKGDRDLLELENNDWPACEKPQRVEGIVAELLRDALWFHMYGSQSYKMLKFLTHFEIG